MDERVSRAITELKRAGIPPLEFALMFTDPRDVKALAEVILVQVKKLSVNITAGQEWCVLQEVFRALTLELGKNQPAGQTALIHNDGNFVALQEREHPVTRAYFREVLADFAAGGMINEEA